VSSTTNHPSYPRNRVIGTKIRCVVLEVMQCILALSSASLHAKQTGLQEFLGQNHTSPAGPDILINNDEQASVSGWTGRLCLPSVEGKSFKAAKTKRIFLGIRWKMRSFQCFSVALYVSP